MKQKPVRPGRVRHAVAVASLGLALAAVIVIAPGTAQSSEVFGDVSSLSGPRR